MPAGDRHRRVAVDVGDDRERAHVHEVGEPLGADVEERATAASGEHAAATPDADQQRRGTRSRAAALGLGPVDEARRRAARRRRRPGTPGRGWSPR